jgi:hypothetical protein
LSQRFANKAVPGIPGRVFAGEMLPFPPRGFVAYDRRGHIIENVAALRAPPTQPG